MTTPDIIAAEALVRAEPGRADAWARLGAARQAAGRLREAAEAFDRALTLDDRNTLLARRLARLLLDLKELAGARHVLAYAEQVNPRDLAVADLLIEAAAALGDWATVERQARKIVTAQPGNREAWRALADALTQRGLFAGAWKALEHVIAGPSPKAEDVAYFARMLINAGEYSRAEATLIKAETAAPADPSVLAARAQLLIYQGRVEEAEDYCLRALKADPANTEALPHLSALRKGRLGAEEEAPLKKLSRSGAEAPARRATASYLLAHSYDARGEIDAAFEEYVYANRLSAQAAEREGYRFDAEGADAWTAHIIKTFKGVPAGLAADARGPAPIFIVGLPRSGSTLIESVLNAHSEVTAAGEAPMAPPMVGRWLKARGIDNSGVLTEEERRQFAAFYMAGAPRGARRFTDKNLLNIEGVGVLAQIFPAAKFINIRRAPLECGLAIYRQDFMKFWTFTTSLENIARRYGQYARLVAHWEKYYGERFLTVQYETFADNFEEETRRLVAFCDLEWQDACRDFHSAERVAATISAVQVREPVKKRSGRADAYAKHLGPLRTALEKAGVDLASGALKGSAPHGPPAA